MNFIKEPIFQKESIKTCVRLRPIANNEEKVFFLQDSQTIVAKNNNRFVFDHVFDQHSSTEFIYDNAAKHIIQQSFRGYNGCIMAYGQTFSGKTHTMKGSMETPGIVPLALSDIFNTILRQDISTKIEVSYMEIYNQKVYDLLADFSNVEVQIQSHENNLIYTNLKQFRVENFQKALSYFNKGEEKRKFASNNLNINSSRSHTIFRIILNVCTENFEELKSQIDLVDLAGSQSIEKTRNEKISKTQGQNINKSLLALSRIFTILSEKKDSKLTRILQKSLCQNSKSSIICMINPTQSNFQESLSTLKFGQNALKIKVQAKQNINRSEESKKQPFFRKMEFLPSEKIELEEARQKIKQQDFYIREQNERIKELEEQFYKKDSNFNIIERKLENSQNQIIHLRQNHENQTKQWWRQQQMLQNRLEYYKEEIDNLQKRNEGLKMDLRQVQKNQKCLVESLQHYENQCKKLKTEIDNIKNKIDEETSKNTKRLSTKIPLMIEKPKPKEKYNPFQLPPYKQDPNRVSPSQLAWIMRLKAQVIDLSRKVNEYTKANIEIAEENDQLRRKIEEYEAKYQKERSSSKINPEALEYNQIKKLNKKIKSLKAELKLSQVNEKKYRNILKKQSNKNLVEMDEFEEWFERKYGGQVFIDKQIQTDGNEQKPSSTSNQSLYFNIKSERGSMQMNQKMQIEQCPFMSSNISPKMNSPSKSARSHQGIIFNNTNPFLRNQNPQQIKNSSNGKIHFTLNEKPVKNENIDLNIVQEPYASLLIPKEDRDSMLLDDLSSDQMDYFENPNRNYLSMDENVRSNRIGKTNMKGKDPSQSSRKQKKEENNSFNISMYQSNTEQKDIDI